MKVLIAKQICIIALASATLVSASFTLAQTAQAPDQGSQQDRPRGEGGMGMGPGQGVRGTVTAISGKQISIKTEQGDTYTVITGDNTRMMKDRGPAAVSDVHAGDMLFVGGVVDAKAKTVGAAFVMVIDAEQLRKMQAELGKTWVAGRITAIEDTKITVKRMDGVMQTIAVDENTSFRKRRESITMADIKVGDAMNARGGLKDGVFVATAFNLGEGGMMGMGGPHGPGGRGRGTGGERPGTDTPPTP